MSLSVKERVNVRLSVKEIVNGKCNIVLGHSSHTK